MVSSAYIIVSGIFDTSLRSLAEDIVSKLSTSTICFYVTFIVAPATNIAFKRVNITICNYRITEANFPSMLVGVMWFICFLCTWKCINNLSLEYDPKTETETYSTKVIQNNANIEIKIGSRSDAILEQQDSDSTEYNNESSDNIGAITKNSFEFNLILLLSFVLGYCSVAFFDIALPLIAA